MIKRKKTRAVRVGDLILGDNNPIRVQSMVNADAHDVKAVVKQILALEEAGCEIVRMGMLDIESAQNIAAIKKQIHIPLVADIHFNSDFALEAIKQGVDKIRINPGNIGDREKTEAVVKAAKKAGVPIRIGVNSGSVEAELLKKYSHPTPEAMVESAAKHVQILEELNFDQILISVKASDVRLMTSAYRLLSQRFDYPLHLGVTEAGPLMSSTVKSSIGIGSLLLDGIGDTIRVSITGDPLEEIKVGRTMLKSLGLQSGPQLISCPTCSRTQWDLIPLAERIQTYLDEKVTAPIKVAVMGCIVNGPGEAREADVGIAGGKGQGVLFVKGKVVATVPEDKMFEVLTAKIEEITKDKEN